MLKIPQRSGAWLSEDRRSLMTVGCSSRVFFYCMLFCDSVWFWRQGEINIPSSLAWLLGNAKAGCISKLLDLMGMAFRQATL